MIKKIVLVVVVLICSAWLFAWPIKVSGDCMEPAVKDGSYVFINRIAPYFRTYKMDDIIIFNYEQKPWIARIVALENDTIKISENSIEVNGVSLQDSVQRNWDSWKYGTYALEESLKVPLGHVYVLSDNLSAHHDDSRVFGPISHASITKLVW